MTEGTVRDALDEPRRAAIMEAIADSPGGLDVGELARATGVHPNTVRWHLQRLEDAALVGSRLERTGRPGRPRRVFYATDGSVEATGYRWLASTLARSLERGRAGREAAVEAGLDAGRDLLEGTAASPQEAIARVVELLDQHGFEATATDVGIEMRHCPFAQLAEELPTIVCGLHEGLLAGALESLGAHRRVVSLEPWVRPGVCVARLE